MSTTCDPLAKWEAKEFERIFPSAVCSGIIGDKRHAARGGYHIGRKWNPRGNYSVVRPDDRSGPDDCSSAIDQSMSKADMIAATKRVLAVWRDKSDPRRKFFNAVNGWLGSGDAIRLDFVTGRKSKASPDHKWHVHYEGRRKWIRSKAAAEGRLSVFRGESKAEYLKRIGVETPPAGAAKPAVPAYPGEPLELGSSGHGVETWQKRLLVRGYKGVGRADGDFGPKCQKATKNFQKACKLKPDGVVGPKTWPMAWTKPL